MDGLELSGVALLSSRQTIVGDVGLKVVRGHQVTTVTVQGQGVVEFCLAPNPYIASAFQISNRGALPESRVAITSHKRDGLNLKPFNIP